MNMGLKLYFFTVETFKVTARKHCNATINSSCHCVIHVTIDPLNCAVVSIVLFLLSGECAKCRYCIC